MSRTAGAALATALAAFLAYAFTLCPTIFTGDSGELATAAATLGFAHPPGYPLWTLIGRVFVFAGGGGDPAFTLNVFSALCAAAAAALLFLGLNLLTGRTLVSAGVAVAFALSRGVWTQAVVTEVYALNLLLTIAALVAALYAHRGRPALFVLAAYLLGLGTANHPFALLAALPVAALALLPSSAPSPAAASPAPAIPPRGAVLARRLLLMAAAFLLGLTVYLYLPLRWMSGLESSWGGIRNLGDIVDHVLRSQYGGLGEAEAHTSLGLRLRVFAGTLDASVPLLFLLAGLYGLLHLVRERRLAEAGVLALFFLLAGPVTAGVVRFEDTPLDRSIVSVYFLPAVLAAFFTAGIGIAALERALTARLASYGRLAAVVTVLVALLIPGAFHQANAQRCDRREAVLARTYAETALGFLPPDARLFAAGDSECFSLYYFHVVKGLRPDVTLVDRTLNVLVRAYGDDLFALPRAERKSVRNEREREIVFTESERPIFYTGEIAIQDFPGCRLVPNGVVYQLLRPGERAVEIPDTLRELPPVDPDDFLESHFAAAILFRQARTLVERGHLDEARAVFAEAALVGASSAEVLRNVGLEYLELGDVGAAEVHFRGALALEPDNENALYNLAILLALTERGPESLAYFERLLAQGVDYPEVHLNYGLQLVRQGRLEEAAVQAERALAQEPELAPALELLAAARKGIEIGGDAGKLEAKARIEPLTVGGTLQLAQRYLERGEIDHATELYRAALQTAPENVGAAYGLGYGLLKAGRFDEAGEAFRRILEVNPESPDGKNALAYVFAETGDSLETAEKLVQEALELAPGMSAYWNDTLGWVRYRAGKYDEALAALEEAARTLPPGDIAMKAENDYHLAKVLRALGRDEEARTFARSSAGRADDEFWLPDLVALSRELGIEEGTI
jgi:tetratricopeptide (TPR) repeat protein